MYTYREITEKDNAAVAALVRHNLEKLNLNIPGTAYYDEGLDHLNDQYGREDAGYYVLTDENGKVVGGLGFSKLPFSMDNGVVSIQLGSADSSANVISRIAFKEENGVLNLTPNEVPASIFCRGGKEFTYTLKQPDELKTICIGKQIIWEAGSPAKPFSAVTSAVYLTRHAYIGDMSANQKTANALNIYSRLGEYENQLETSSEPYGWIIRLKDSVPADREAVMKADMQDIAYILIAVIDNLDHVIFEYTVDMEARTISYDAAEATSFFGSNIKDCSGSIGLLEELVEKTRY